METKDIALIYGGELIGKGTDTIINMYVTDPTQLRMLKVGLAAGLPLATQFIDLPEKVETIFLLMGAFLATKA